METLYTEAIQAENIVLNTADGKQVKASKDLIIKASSHLAAIIEHTGGVLNFQDQSSIAIHMFVFYCYQGRLPPFNNESDTKKRNLRKRKLINLWMFCDAFTIPKLQNEAMKELLDLFITTPHLLTKTTIQHIWKCSPLVETPLKWLTVYTIVAQIEEGTGDKKKKVSTIDEFEEFETQPGFMRMIYKALQTWDEYEMPKSPKKGKPRSKWAIMAASEDVKKAIIVDERPRGQSILSVGRPVEVQQDGTQGGTQCGNQDATQAHTKDSTQEAENTPGAKNSKGEKTVAIKREAPEDGEEEGSPSKKAKGFMNGEIIVIDED